MWMHPPAAAQAHARVLYFASEEMRWGAVRWSEKLIRRALGRDREHTARLLNRIGYERVI